MAGPLRADVSLPHSRLHGAGYGAVLILILQSATLLAALHVSGVQHWIIHTATVLATIACLSAAGILVGSGELGELASRLVGLMLVIFAPAAIVLGIARHFRTVGGVTVTTMFGVLCIYLLVGMAFGFLYGIIASIESESFFANGSNGNQSDFLYFSFASLTTTGYGDLTAGTDVGRSFAITEALLGQIYLVTVVALIVGNIGRQRQDA